MVADLLKLTVLFFVIIDPFMSYAVFFTTTRGMEEPEKKKIAGTAVLIAAAVSFLVLLLGDKLLEAFSTDLADFKVAGGIILGILGIKMTLGQPITEPHQFENKSARAIAAIIGSPLLTGPAAITAIIVSVEDCGMWVTGLALTIVLLFTAVLLYQATRIDKLIGKSVIQVVSTVLGLITLSWGVMFVRGGLDF